MKNLLLGLIMLAASLAQSQDEKTVTLTVSGQGKTQDEAKQSALRSAIEQAFGAFISSRTEVINDQLIKDEIISVSNGNIQKYVTISEVKIPDNGYATTLSVTVSVSRLTSFAESKGVEVEFKGALLAVNLKQQLLNETSEEKVVEYTISVLKSMIDQSLDFTLTTGQPTQNKETKDIYTIPLRIDVKLNQNISAFPDYLRKCLQAVSLTKAEAKDYETLNKEYYRLTCNNETYYLRNKRSMNLLITNLTLHFVRATYDITVDNNVSQVDLSKIWCMSCVWQDFGMFDSGMASNIQRIAYISNFMPINQHFGLGLRTENGEKIYACKNIYEIVYWLRRFNPGYNYETMKVDEFLLHDDDGRRINKATFNINSIKKDMNIAEIRLELNYALDEINKLSNFKIVKNQAHKN